MDGNVIIWHTLAGISPMPYRFDIPNLDTFYSAFHTDIILRSDTWTNKMQVHSVTQTYLWNNTSGVNDYVALIPDVTDVSIQNLNNIKSGTGIIQNNQQNEIIIRFKTASEIPSSGSILIVFNADYANVYPHCRSHVTALPSPSALHADLVPTIKTGSISCRASNTGNIGWYITGFDKIQKDQHIIIVGKVKLANILTAMKITTTPLDIYLFHN